LAKVDGRKFNGGHPNSGRKPKADEITMIQLMDATKAPAEVWVKLAELVGKGDSQAIKTWLSYRYGQPKQQIDVSTDSASIVVWKEA
jgi:hypothetical protein